MLEKGLLIIFFIFLIPLVRASITFNEWGSYYDSVWFCWANNTCVQRTGTTPDLFPDNVNVGSQLYFLVSSSEAQVNGLQINIVTPASSGLRGVWQYPTGRSGSWVWNNFTGVVDTSNNFSLSGLHNITWDLPPFDKWNNYAAPAPFSASQNKHYHFHLRFLVTNADGVTEGGNFTLTSTKMKPWTIYVYNENTTMEKLYQNSTANGWGCIEKGTNTSYTIKCNIRLAYSNITTKNEQWSFDVNRHLRLDTEARMYMGKVYSGDKVYQGTSILFNLVDRSFAAGGAIMGASNSEWLNGQIRVVCLSGYYCQGFWGGPGSTPKQKVYGMYFEGFRHETFSASDIGVLNAVYVGHQIEGAGAIIANPTAYAGSHGWRITTAQATIHGADFSKVISSPVNAYLYNNNNTKNNCTDCNFGTWTYDKYVSWSAGSGYNNSLLMQASLIIRYIMPDGTPIENATVTIKDKNGTIVAELKTNPDGYASNEFGKVVSATWSNVTVNRTYGNSVSLRFREILITNGTAVNERKYIPAGNNATFIPVIPDFQTIPPAASNYIIVPYITYLKIYPAIEGTTSTVWSNYTNYNPFTITIEKEGYETYNVTMNIGGKLNLLAVAKPQGAAGAVGTALGIGHCLTQPYVVIGEENKSLEIGYNNTNLPYVVIEKK